MPRRSSLLRKMLLPVLALATLALSTGVEMAQDAAPVSRPDSPALGINEARKIVLPKLPTVAEHVLRFPVLSPNGKKIAFVHDGDIWEADRDGGKARRLTITQDNEWEPSYSPDGLWIAFRSMRYGGYDIFIMPSEGGQARRLTWDDAADLPCTWLPDSSGLIFASGRRNAAYDLWVVRLDGTEPWPITDGGFRESEFSAAISPDGSKIAYVHNGGTTSYRRRGYQGAASNDLWVCDFDGRLTSNHRALAASGYNENNPVFLDNDHILFTAFDGNEDHRLSRFRVAEVSSGELLDAGDTLADLRDMREVSFTTGGLAFSTGAYGGWKIGTLGIAENGGPEEFVKWPTFDLGTDHRDAGMRVLNQRSASEFAVSPNGKLLAFIAGGEVYLQATVGGAASKRITDTIEAESQLSFAPDSLSLLYTSQRKGGVNLFTYDLVKESEHQLTDSPDGISSALFAADGKTIYCVEGENTIRSLDLTGKFSTLAIAASLHGTNRESGHAIGLSPKGRWLVYPGENELGNAVVMVADLHHDGATQQLSHRFGDAFEASFSDDGKRLAFICNEVDDYDIYLIDLQREEVTFAEDKLAEAFKAPEKKEVKPAEADAAKPADPAPAKPALPQAKPEVEPIDFDKLSDRSRRVTNHRGNERSPVVIGETIYFLSSNGGATNLWSLSVKGGAAKQVTSTTTGKSGLMPSADFKTLWLTDNNRPTRLNLNGTGALGFAINESQRRDATALRQAVFNEAVWVMKNYFYDPNLHGLPWGQIAAHYAQIIPDLTTQDDFSSIMNELFGELNSSHQGFTTVDPRSDGYSESVGHIGLIFDAGQLADGDYFVKEVIAGGPCDYRESEIKAGQYLVGVNDTLFADRAGRPINLARLLLDSVGKKTLLHFASSPDAKKVTVTPVKPITGGAESALYYQRWVDHQRALVHTLSQGRLGYVHIARQDGASMQDFKHELGDDNMGREGLVIDVRYNGGGSTAVDQLEILFKKTWLIRRPRGAQHSVSENIYRSTALEKPTCLLTNGSSFSNAEILAEGFRRLKIGPIIGDDTGGGVIGTSRHTLIDGSTMRLPLSGAYAIDGTNLENNGRKPDFEVDNTPEVLNAGRDLQTEKAVEELLKRLKK